MSERRDVLKEILDSYKFKRMYAARQTLAELLVERIPVLPSTVTVVPIPTVPSHIRQRGYDHALSMARIVAKRKKVKLDPLLRRKTLTVQTGTSRKERQQQAKAAFELKKTDLSGIYLLLDDVVTTGATLKAAASLLRQHGADEVWAAVIVRQPIDS